MSVIADKTGDNATADMPDLRPRPSRPGLLRRLSLASLRSALPGRVAPWGVLIGLLLYALSAGQAYGRFDEPVELRYRFTWAGLPFAELGLRHATNSTVYQTEIAIRTIGLADQVVGFRASSHATGLYEEPDGFSASRYRSASSSHRKSRRIMVRYDRDTGDVVELELTRSGKPDRSKVPADLQKGVMDPLTAVLQMRHRLATAGDLDGYKAAVFDGRRRFDATARVIGRQRAEIAGRTWPVIELEIDLTWLAGANSDDMDKAEAGENLLRLKLLLSDDERLIPLRLSTMDSLFTATAEIVPECLAPAGCTLVSG